MNIQTVAQNLRNTIRGKEEYVADLRYQSTLMSRSEEMATKVTIQYVEINFNELRKILADVEVCCEKATLDSWRDNPDRSGGQFTQDEIDNARKW
jgi:hypothetical protein